MYKWQNTIIKLHLIKSRISPRILALIIQHIYVYSALYACLSSIEEPWDTFIRDRRQGAWVSGTDRFYREEMVGDVMIAHNREKILNDEARAGNVTVTTTATAAFCATDWQRRKFLPFLWRLRDWIDRSLIRFPQGPDSAVDILWHPEESNFKLRFSREVYNFVVTLLTDSPLPLVRYGTIVIGKSHRNFSIVPSISNCGCGENFNT